MIDRIALIKSGFFTAFIGVVTALLLIAFSGCNRYTSNYKAVAFVHHNATKNASMSFSSFEGTFVFNLKCESNDEKIRYSAEVE